MQPTYGIGSIVPLLFMFAVFYFLIIRPQQKKQKEHDFMIQNLKKNDEVVTSGGIHGTIINTKDKSFVLRIDDNVKVEIDKNAISYVERAKK